MNIPRSDFVRANSIRNESQTGRVYDAGRKPLNSSSNDQQPRSTTQTIEYSRKKRQSQPSEKNSFPRRASISSPPSNCYSQRQVLSFHDFKRKLRLDWGLLTSSQCHGSPKDHQEGREPKLNYVLYIQYSTMFLARKVPLIRRAFSSSHRRKKKTAKAHHDPLRLRISLPMKMVEPERPILNTF